MLSFTVFSAFLIFIDFVAKLLAGVTLGYGKVVTIIPKVLRLVYVENKGAAFGLFQNKQYILALVAILVIAYLIRFIYLKQYTDKLQYYGAAFLLSGAIGNLIDRLTLGYVIDFIDLPYWPTFNLADIFINVGVVLFIISLLKQKK